MINTSAPFFSIVIPTYNRASFIGITIQSVLAQTDSSLEIIVVDDGSQDNTAEVVAQFSDLRLSYYPRENAERGAARNYGFSRAKGDYVIFLDSDDRFHPEHLSTLHHRIKILGQPNFIATKYDFDRDGIRADSDVTVLPEGWYGLDTFVRGNALACNICVRRHNTNLFMFEEDRRYAAVEDWMFMLQNTQNDKVYLIDAVTLTMNDHDTRSMRSDNTALVRRLQLALDWMVEQIALTSEQRRILTGRIYYLCAIHAYADNHRGISWRYARQAAAYLPKSQAAVLLLRCMLGEKIVGLVKKIQT